MENGNLKMLARAPRLGARMSLTLDGCTLAISTVLYGNQRYTRVESEGCETLHYSGVLNETEAARNYLDGTGCVEAA